MSYSNATIASHTLLPTFTTPPSAGWSWVNQGGAAVATDAAGAIVVTAPAGAGNSLRLRTRTKSGNDDITAYVQHLGLSVCYNGAFIGVRDSATGKVSALNIFGFDGGGSDVTARMQVSVLRYTNATTYSSTPIQVRAPFRECWLRIVDNGTNFSFEYNSDPYAGSATWISILSESRTAWTATPDQWVFGAESNDGTWPSGVRLCSWSETA